MEGEAASLPEENPCRSIASTSNKHFPNHSPERPMAIYQSYCVWGEGENKDLRDTFNLDFNFKSLPRNHKHLLLSLVRKESMEDR